MEKGFRNNQYREEVIYLVVAIKYSFTEEGFPILN